MTPAERIAAHSEAAVEMVTSAMRNGAVLTEVEVTFGPFTIVAAYRTEGRYWPADENGPAEYPTIDVKRCTVLCGAHEPWELPFALFPESTQDEIMDAAREQECA